MTLCFLACGLSNVIQTNDRPTSKKGSPGVAARYAAPIAIAFPQGWRCFQRVHLDIQVGEHAVDYQQVAAKDKLTELQLRIRQLLDQVEMITKEQNYQRVSRLLRRAATANVRSVCVCGRRVCVVSEAQGDGNVGHGSRGKYL